VADDLAHVVVSARRGIVKLVGAHALDHLGGGDQGPRGSVAVAVTVAVFVVMARSCA
jgi:hypothetical protein